MSKMTIEVEFLAGTPLEEAVKEAKEKAKLWQVAFVKFNFNGVPFSISENASVSKCILDYTEGTYTYSIVS